MYSVLSGSRVNCGLCHCAVLEFKHPWWNITESYDDMFCVTLNCANCNTWCGLPFTLIGWFWLLSRVSNNATYRLSLKIGRSMFILFFVLPLKPQCHSPPTSNPCTTERLFSLPWSHQTLSDLVYGLCLPSYRHTLNLWAHFKCIIVSNSYIFHL